MYVANSMIYPLTWSVWVMIPGLFPIRKSATSTCPFIDARCNAVEPYCKNTYNTLSSCDQQCIYRYIITMYVNKSDYSY